MIILYRLKQNRLDLQAFCAILKMKKSRRRKVLNPTLVIAAFLGLWLVLFIPFMILNAKRKKKAESFVSGNNDKAVIHLYCKNIKINGQNVSVFNPVTGEGLEKIVALEPGSYTFAGSFTRGLSESYFMK